MTGSLMRVAHIAGTTRDTINRWQARGVLCIPFPPTTQGVARELSRENALEILFVAELVRGGWLAAEAGEEARKWIARLQNGTAKSYFVRNARTGESAWCDGNPWDFAYSLSDTQEGEQVHDSYVPASTSPPEPISVQIVNVAQLVASLEGLADAASR